MMLINRIKRKLKRQSVVDYWREKGAKIGNDCEIYSSASFGSEPYLISIGNHVRINVGVKLVTHDGGVWVLRGYKEKLKDIDMFGKITVGDNVHIGTDAMVMPGVTIGSNVIIGCKAVVTKDIPNNSVAVGIPARVIETVDEYLEKHFDDFEHTKGMNPNDKKAYLLKKYNMK